MREGAVALLLLLGHLTHRALAFTPHSRYPLHLSRTLSTTGRRSCCYGLPVVGSRRNSRGETGPAAAAQRRISVSRRGGLLMHIGHHHHHGEDDHDHHHHGHHHHHHHPHSKDESTALVGVKGLVQYVLRVIARKRQTIAGVLLGAIAVVGMRSMRGVQRVSKMDLGVLCVVATFVLAVETTKSYVTMLSRNFGQLVTSWKHHWSLRQLQRLSPETTITTKLSEGAREADRVTWLGIYVNLGLFALKFVAGFLGNSAAMIADAGHTLSDLVSDAVTLWAVRMSSLPPDDDHPYGHGRFEAVGSLGVSVLLLMTAWHIAAHAYDKLQHAISIYSFSDVASWTAVRGGHVAAGVAAAPTVWAVGAAVASIVIKELLYQTTASVGLKHNSPVLIANAWHHRSDAISSIMALGGIVAARAGLAALDPLAGILVTAMVGLTGMQILVDSMSQLTDTVDSASIPRIQKVVDGVEGVIEASNIRARRMGPQMLVDLLIRIDCNLSASAAQQVAEQVRWRILRALPMVREVLVHTKTEPMPCPVASELRTPSEIEQDTRLAVNALGESHIRSVPRVIVHYMQMQPTVEVLLQVDASLTVNEASAVASRVREAVEALPDIVRAEVHLDLTGSSVIAATGLALS